MFRFPGEISHANSTRASMVFRIAFHPLLLVLRSGRSVECTARRARMISFAISTDSWILRGWMIAPFRKCSMGIYLGMGARSALSITHGTSSPVESCRSFHCRQLNAISGKRGCKIILNVMHDADSCDLWIVSGWDLRPF